ncbi:hypothetical protein [Shewanella sp. UCD-KL12]|uniref:hypothetical protein n=1 Tax=Shewanella sp. UCD-KL12 TaxID=1917163 RepID=UPI001180B90D|nr:hypothetical protein [Shewanella sp. UCD-KL12]
MYSNHLYYRWCEGCVGVLSMQGGSARVINWLRMSAQLSLSYFSVRMTDVLLLLLIDSNEAL